MKRTFLILLVFCLGINGWSKNKRQNFWDLTAEISQFIENSNPNPTHTELGEIQARLKDFQRRKLAKIKSKKFDLTYRPLLDVADKFDNFVDRTCAAQPKPLVMLGLAESYFRLFDELGEFHQNAFKALEWEKQFQNMLPQTQSRNVYHYLQTDAIYLASVALGRCDVPETCTKCWKVLEKMVEKLDFERFSFTKHVNKDILGRKLEKILETTEIILEKDLKEPDPVVRKANSDLVNLFRAHQNFLRAHLESVKEQTQSNDLEKSRAFFNKGNEAVDVREKLRFYSQAIVFDRAFVAAFKNRGNIYQQLGQDSLAILDYSEVIRLDPGYALAFTYRGISYSNLGKYQQAIADFDAALSRNPEHAQTYNGKGTALRNLGELEKAVQDYQQAVSLNPNYTLAFQNLGLCYNKLKKYPQAITAYNRAIELAPETASNYYNLGCIYWALNQWPAVIRNWEKCLELEPNHPQVNKWMAKAKREAQY